MKIKDSEIAAATLQDAAQIYALAYGRWFEPDWAEGEIELIRRLRTQVLALQPHIDTVSILDALRTEYFKEDGEFL